MLYREDMGMSKGRHQKLGRYPFYPTLRKKGTETVPLGALFDSL